MQFIVTSQSGYGLELKVESLDTGAIKHATQRCSRVVWMGGGARGDE